MLLVEAMDEGPLLGYGEQPIDPDETTATLTTKLIGLSYGLLLHNLAKVHEQNGLPGVSQSVTGKQISYSRKLTKADGVIDWTKPAIELEREVRAFIEWPKSRTVLGGKDIILTRAHTTPEKIANTKPGDLRIMDDTNELGIITADGILWIDNLKPAGKKEMPIRAFLAGYRQLLQD